jgi:UDP-N-acetylglucosamine--N-acetylmuramyl-(pentapeptide) pyrophosphoryl-undecaprenol N-acetylglucosamine transferase
MTSASATKPLIAIACGGTGGHLFPGLAVAGQLQQHGCDVALLISPKDVDQQAVKSASGMAVFTLPAVGLQNRNYFSFAGSFLKSLRAARNLFRQRQPAAVLAMGGFTSAPPIFAARNLGAKTFLHESNTIPGRANRLLARFVDEAFVGFPDTAARLAARTVTPTGTPVRPQFHPRPAAGCRPQLGLDARRPTLLVVGGSQGATGLNTLVLSALGLLGQKNWQWLHLTGPGDFEKVKAAYAGLGIAAVVKPFLAEMDLALGAATAVVSRAGASSLAEIAALQLPALLVPFPAAADNHQFFNAQIYAASGAARLLEQKDATPEKVADLLAELMENEPVRDRMAADLKRWHTPAAAATIAANILRRSSTAIGRSPPGGETSGSGPARSLNLFAV